MACPDRPDYPSKSTRAHLTRFSTRLHINFYNILILFLINKELDEAVFQLNSY